MILDNATAMVDGWSAKLVSSSRKTRPKSNVTPMLRGQLTCEVCKCQETAACLVMVDPDLDRKCAAMSSLLWADDLKLFYTESSWSIMMAEHHLKIVSHKPYFKEQTKSPFDLNFTRSEQQKYLLWFNLIFSANTRWSWKSSDRARFTQSKVHQKYRQSRTEGNRPNNRQHFEMAANFAIIPALSSPKPGRVVWPRRLKPGA